MVLIIFKLDEVNCCFQTWIIVKCYMQEYLSRIDILIGPGDNIIKVLTDYQAHKL